MSKYQKIGKNDGRKDLVFYPNTSILLGYRRIKCEYKKTNIKNDVCLHSERIASLYAILSSSHVYCAGLKVAATVLIELCVSSSCLSSSVITRGFGKFSIGFSCSWACFLACSSLWC